MKIRMEEGLQLIVTAESYVEQVALAQWVEAHQGEGDLLIEAYAQQGVQRTATPEPVCTCKVTAESYKNCDAHGNRRR